MRSQLVVQWVSKGLLSGIAWDKQAEKPSHRLPSIEVDSLLLKLLLASVASRAYYLLSI